MKNLQKALVLTLLLSASHCIKATTSVHLSDVDNCFIDKMVKEEENKTSPFYQAFYHDVDMTILSFVPTQDLVACSRTSPKFYTLVNRFDRRHDLIKASNEVANLLKLYKDDPNVKQREPVREAIDRLLKDLSVITESHSVYFIAQHPTARHYFTHELSFFKRLLDLYKKQINTLYGTPIARPIYEHIRDKDDELLVFQKAFSLLINSPNEQKMRNWGLVEATNPEFDADLNIFLYCLNISSAENNLNIIGELDFNINKVHDHFNKLLADKKHTTNLFGILAQKYPSKESIDSMDKIGLKRFVLTFREQIEGYATHPDLFGEMVYFIQNRGINKKFLDKYIAKVSNEERNRDSLKQLKNIQANLASYKSLNIITTAATAFLTSTSKKIINPKN